MKGSTWRNRRLRMAMWGGAALLLLVPLIAMQVSTGVVWDVTDFATLGVMLVLGCGAYELAVRMTRSRARRAIVGVAIAAAFFLVWLNLAVGILPN